MSVVTKIKRNPALVIASLVAAAQLVLEFVVDVQEALPEGTTSWSAVATVVAGLLIRQRVSPVPEVKQQVTEAWVEGVRVGQDNSAYPL